jgi:hypothetical protein
MATDAVPGADPKNLDTLSVGCWAEDAKQTSLVLVVGHEGGSVVFDLYDLDQQPPLFYRDAMIEEEFKRFFSVPPTGKSDIRWTWHDKTNFPWDRVMKRLSTKAPQHADVEEQLTVAQRVAQKLGLRGRKLAEEDITARSTDRRTRGMAVLEKIADVLGAVVEPVEITSERAALEPSTKTWRQRLTRRKGRGK